LLLREIFFFSLSSSMIASSSMARQTNSIQGFHFRVSESRLQIHPSAPLTSNRACHTPSLLPEDNTKTKKKTDNYSLNEIRTHGQSIRVVGNSTCARWREHCFRSAAEFTNF
jgi:hypothetical protein